MTRSIRVLVTGVSGGSIGEQVCKALRHGQYAYHIVATNTEVTPMAVVKAEQHALLPPASSSNYLESLLDLVERYAEQFVIPGSEPELVLHSEHRKALEDAGVRVLINSSEVIATCVDKSRALKKLSRDGFPVPATLKVEDSAELDELPDGPPWIIKPTQGGGSSAVFIAQDSHELRFFTDYLLAHNYCPLVQTYVGSVDHEYTVGILHTPNGEFMGSMVIHRQILSGLSNRFRLPNRTGRSELGSALAVSSGISQGRIVNCPPVQARAEAIADTLGSIGPLNIQGRLVGEDFVPFEINPRFSGTTPMRALAGFNEPELLIRWHLQPDNLWRRRLRIKQGEFTRGLTEYFTPDEDVDVDSNA